MSQIQILQCHPSHIPLFEIDYDTRNFLKNHDNIETVIVCRKCSVLPEYSDSLIQRRDLQGNILYTNPRYKDSINGPDTEIQNNGGF